MNPANPPSEQDLQNLSSAQSPQHLLGRLSQQGRQIQQGQQSQERLLLKLTVRRWTPPSRKTIAEWAEQKRYLSNLSAFPGKFRFDLVPFIREPLECLSDARVREVCAQKSAQITWTDGVLCNWLGHIADENPAPTIVLFPADKKGKEFNREKFEPMIEATPALQLVLTTKSRAKESTQDFKEFPGGFIKFAGSNSPGNVKSTSAKFLAVEEPDDCNLNIKGQGDSITLLEERGKTYPDKKMLVGGTPTIKGVSAIEARMKLSDQRYWHVPCHDCGEAGPLEWKHVLWSSDAGQNHEIFGNALPETARYACPSCGSLWSNAEKNANVKRGRWVAKGEFKGVAGFFFSELMSPFADSALERLVHKYLVAKHALEAEGDVTKIIAFWNSSLGLPYEYTGTVADAKHLEARVEDYPEWYVPWGGLIITVGVDVQHDRLAISVKAWGEGMESWLIWFGELHGNVLEQAVWDELDALVVFRRYQHVSGADMAVSAVTVDCGDGQTANAVYTYARRANRRFGVDRVLPGRGSSKDTAEIFKKPAGPLDVTAAHKAAKYGLRVYQIGVSRAKDLVLGSDENAGRINLRDATGATGRGPGRMHWYRGVRADYFDQLTAEVKAPARNQPRGKKVWQKKAGKRNEALDTEVYSLHAALAMRLDLYTQARWDAVRRSLLQASLFAPDARVLAEAQGQQLVPAQGPGGDDAGAVSDTGAEAGTATPVPTAPATASAAIAARAAAKPGGRRVRSAGVRL